MSDVAASHVELGAGSERRMINRLAAYWEQLRGERTFPSMRDIEANQLEEIRSNCFVLDISESVDEPVIRFIGDALSEGGTVARSGDPLAGVSKRSLFGRISEHFLECIANGAPVGIEAEFDDDKGETILYRGVVVPFSDDDEHIDFVLGAVNCKVKGDEGTEDAAPDSDALADETADQGAPDMVADNDDEPAMAEPVAGEVAAEAPDTGPLLESLSQCQRLAREAKEIITRSRDALYTALGEAYRFHFEAEAAPEAYQAILANVGIETQERAPYTPIVKLIFGADYDKTRLSEYAAALAYGLRHGVPQDGFKSFLDAQEGGIKACVAAERSERRAEKGEAWDSIAFARSILREQPVLGHVDDIEIEDESEFVLMLGRREPTGHGVDIVKVLHEKPSLVDGILRRAAIDVPNSGPDPDEDHAASGEGSDPEAGPR